MHGAGHAMQADCRRPAPRALPSIACAAVRYGEIGKNPGLARGLTAHGLSTGCQPLSDDPYTLEVARLPGLVNRPVQRVATAASVGLRARAVPDRG